VTPEQLQTELGAETLRPVYLVVGEEALYREESEHAIRDTVFPDGVVDFDYERLDGATANGASLLNAVGTLPVLARQRLIVMRDPEPARGKGKGIGEAIFEAIDALEEGGDAVLVVVAAKVDGRARWVKKLGTASQVRCDPPKGARALESFVRAEAKRQEIRFDKAAVALMAERTGSNLLMLRQEIAKAGLFAGPGQKVTAEHVAVSTNDVAEEPIWDLTDAIGEGRIADAMTVLGKLLGSGGAPPAILGALVTHFRKLLATRTGGRVAGPPFAVKKLENQSRRFTPGRLVSCMRAIHQTDLALKGAGSLPPDLALERLVIGLTGATAARRSS
jgi:DNA polymerase-3 subunit delta